MKLFYLFLYCGEIQRETVARKRCNLTLNLCTKACVQKKRRKKHIKDKIQGFGPDLSGTFFFFFFYQMNKPTLLDFKVMGGFYFFSFFFSLCFLGYWTIYVSHSPASSPNHAPAEEMTERAAFW